MNLVRIPVAEAVSPKFFGGPLHRQEVPDSVKGLSIFSYPEPPNFHRFQVSSTHKEEVEIAHPKEVIYRLLCVSKINNDGLYAERFAWFADGWVERNEIAGATLANLVVGDVV